MSDEDPKYIGLTMEQIRLILEYEKKYQLVDISQTFIDALNSFYYPEDDDVDELCVQKERGRKQRI